MVQLTEVTFNETTYEIADFYGYGLYEVITAGTGQQVERWIAVHLDAMADLASNRVTTSTSSVAIGTGSKTFVLAVDLPLFAGVRGRGVDTANSANYVDFTISSYTSATKTAIVSVAAGEFGGSGTIASWNLMFGTGAPGLTGASGGTDIVLDTTPQLGGDLDCNGKNLTDVQELRIDATPDTDHAGTGPTTSSINAGATIAAFDLVYLHTDGEWAKTDADAAATATGMLGIALESGTDGNAMKVALSGSFVRDDTWNWTVGGALYIDTTTAGGMTQTAPSGSADVVRIVGWAVSADVVYFCPSTAAVVVV